MPPKRAAANQQEPKWYEVFLDKEPLKGLFWRFVIPCVAVWMGFALQAYVFNVDEIKVNYVDPEAAARHIRSGSYVKQPERFNPKFAQYNAKSLANDLMDNDGTWLVLVGMKATGKTTMALQVAKEMDGPSIFVELENFSEEASLRAILYDRIYPNGAKDGRGRSTALKASLAEAALNHVGNIVTVVLDLTSKAKHYSVEDLDKAIKAATENLNVRFVVTASEGVPWSHLKDEPRRHMWYFREHSEQTSIEYYNAQRQQHDLPTVEDDRLRKDVLANIRRSFLYLGEMAKVPELDDQVAKATEAYSNTRTDVGGVLVDTCPPKYQKELAGKLTNGTLSKIDLRRVCGGNFVELAKEAHQDVDAWFADKYVRPDIAFLPKGGAYAPQADVVKKALHEIAAV